MAVEAADLVAVEELEDMAFQLPMDEVAVDMG